MVWIEVLDPDRNAMIKTNVVYNCLSVGISTERVLASGFGTLSTFDN